MKVNLRLAVLIGLVLLLLFTGGAQAHALFGVTPAAPDSAWTIKIPDEIVLGSNYNLKDGETLDGNLWILGGNANIEQGGRVTGDIRLVGGNLVVDGEVGGNIAATGGTISLGNTAQIGGNIDLMGTTLDRASQARVEGQVSNSQGPFVLAPGLGGTRVPDIRIYNPFWPFLSFLFRSFLMAALSVLAVMFLPRQTERVAQAVRSPVVSGGVGLLTILVVPIVLVVMMLTLILIPVSLLGILLFGILLLFGWVAVGVETGQRLAQLLRKEWTLPLATLIGTFTLTVVAMGIGNAIACVGWMVPTAVALVGLGAVILTRFGTRPYPPYPLTTSYPVVPPPIPPHQGIYPSQPSSGSQGQPPFSKPEL